ncbi:MAG: hypothetical protein AAGB29_12865, partial [Planctomycetota bacterium]
LLVVLAAGVWVGSILTFGLSAGSTFATVRDLQPSLTDPARPPEAPDFSEVIFDAGQPEYVAGRVVSGFTDRALLPISLAACVLLVVGVILAHIASRRAPWVRYALVVISIGLIAGALYATLMMEVAHGKMYMIAHQKPDPVDYQAHFREMFDGYHAIAERLFGLIGITQLALLSVTVMSPLPSTASPTSTSPHEEPTDPPPGDA